MDWYAFVACIPFTLSAGEEEEHVSLSRFACDAKTNPRQFVNMYVHSIRLKRPSRASHVYTTGLDLNLTSTLLLLGLDTASAKQQQ